MAKNDEKTTVNEATAGPEVTATTEELEWTRATDAQAAAFYNGEPEPGRLYRVAQVGGEFVLVTAKG